MFEDLKLQLKNALASAYESTTTDDIPISCKDSYRQGRDRYHEFALIALDAAIDDLAAQGRIVPDGWVAVPREPTEGMYFVGDTASENGCVTEVYKAMIAAAPKIGGELCSQRDVNYATNRQACMCLQV